jgi:hypothetical protein
MATAMATETVMDERSTPSTHASGWGGKPEGGMTDQRQNPARARHRPRAGVCLVRVEAQTGTFLITVRQNPDVEVFSGESVTLFSEVEPVLAAVRDFLEGFMTLPSRS